MFSSFDSPCVPRFLASIPQPAAFKRTRRRTGASLELSPAIRPLRSDATPPQSRGLAQRSGARYIRHDPFINPFQRERTRKMKSDFRLPFLDPCPHFQHPKLNLIKLRSTPRGPLKTFRSQGVHQHIGCTVQKYTKLIRFKLMT